MREFLGMEQLDESTWRFRVTDRLITPGKFLFGGSGLASGIVALEAASERPTIYAAAHYLSFAPLDAEVIVKVDLAVVGRRVTQARAIATESDREVLTVNAALGTGDLTAPTPWLTFPDVPPPEECRQRVNPRHVHSSIFDHLETRIANGRGFESLDGTPGSPVSALWARVPEPPGSISRLARSLWRPRCGRQQPATWAKHHGAESRQHHSSRHARSHRVDTHRDAHARAHRRFRSRHRLSMERGRNAARHRQSVHVCKVLGPAIHVGPAEPVL